MLMETAQQLGVERYAVRKPDRVRIALNTKLRLADQPDVDVSVRNISSRGFMAEADRDLPIGSDAMVYLPGIGWAMASIRWSVGHKFGGRFSESVNMRQFWRANPPRRPSADEEGALDAA
jgi:hypothetical protein